MTDEQLRTAAGLTVLGVLAVVVVMVIRRLRLRRLATAQLQRLSDRVELDEEFAEEQTRSYFRQWLYISGFRASSAPLQFVLITLLFGMLGMLTMVLWIGSGLLTSAKETLDAVPSNLGALGMPIVVLSPLMVVGFPALIPLLVVRARRRQVVREITEDFPIFLDLLATLTESGLGFDQALERMAGLQPGDRLLAREISLFRADLIAGQTRIDALRRLSDRLDIPIVEDFTSAVAQAEQVGSGLSRTVRLLAEDHRQQRRESALTLAQSLALKLIVPLVLFFSPALFVVTLGPTVYRVFARLGQFTEEVVPPTNADRVEQERLQREELERRRQELQNGQAN